jgi:hypothetical protein
VDWTEPDAWIQRPRSARLRAWSGSVSELRDLSPGSVPYGGHEHAAAAPRRRRIPGGDAEAALGHRIEIVSGYEEARLIYLGVAHAIPEDGQRRLVVDIGGGSTEVIVGENTSPLMMESLHMGCVSMTPALSSRWRSGQGGVPPPAGTPC